LATGDRGRVHVPGSRCRYDGPVLPPDDGDTWCGVGAEPLPIGAIYDWCLQPNCGAVVLFSGTVRDHAADSKGDRRDGVDFLIYEAYEEQTLPVLQAIAAEARTRWTGLGRIAILHRVGKLFLEESSVVVAVSSAHRPEAFEAARFGIDALKRSAPIWKQESWEGGLDWGLGAHEIESMRPTTTDVA
jgi:molybdopterin synthase catalytic subunit